ncbi:hypothetical protein JMJ56_11390 [Belnapia sp. T18]|uniref:Uncharacterized protein n=1 Tax=Belnapia arida TaxID=2804533 RepID=A0ABS1U1S1_9PROT|nr:hypothetical protein [Belnapia arida]MBL6078612.1 hypothetical protein [Belnapia arida]
MALDPTEPVNMTPINYENWGKLIKTWATGNDYVGNGHEYPVPETLDEVKRQLAAANTGLTLPARIQKLQVVVGRSDTLLLRLPPPDLVEASEKRLAKKDYALPGFYNDHFGCVAPALPDKDARMKFHAQRIGDYSIANCQ